MASFHDTLRRFERGELRVEDAAALLGLKRRPVCRLLERRDLKAPRASYRANVAGQRVPSGLHGAS